MYVCMHIYIYIFIFVLRLVDIDSRMSFVTLNLFSRSLNVTTSRLSITYFPIVNETTRTDGICLLEAKAL